MMPAKPVARVSEVNRPLWEGFNRQKLMLQQCAAQACQKFIYYPRVCCPFCGGDELEWSAASGRGKIVSFTRVHRAQHESFAAEIPYYFLAVQLDEGPLMFSRLEGNPPSEHNLIGCPVSAVFVSHTPTQQLPFFRLV